MGHVLRFARVHEVEALIAVDDDATTLYAHAGVVLGLEPASPFTQAERLRWQRALTLQRVFVAVDGNDQPLGFAALDVIDHAPYLDQLSVRMDAMRRGIGRALLRQACDWAVAQHAEALWLTTYDHLPWNRPWYERMGFHVVPETAWKPDIAHHVAEQRRFLPDPDQRVVMRKPLDRKPTTRPPAGP